MQMANAFLLHAVEAACMDHLNSRKCQLSLPEKVVIFNTIGAESAKVFCVFHKNSKAFFSISEVLSSGPERKWVATKTTTSED